MKLSEKDVAYVARLARLALTEDEKKLYASQFEKILAHMDELNKLDTSQVPPTAHAGEAANVLRDDVLEPCEPGPLLELAPAREGGCYKVQKVIE